MSANSANVLETGKIVLAGVSKQLAASDEVRKSHLGVKCGHIRGHRISGN